MIQEDPPSEILEYLVPRAVEENCSIQLASSGEEKENIKEECVEEEESENDLEGCSIEEIDLQIARLNKLANAIQLKLKVYQRAREKKLESSCG